MPKIVKLNYDRKVRYLYDKDTEECERLAEQVIEHYGQFLSTPHSWYMDDLKRYYKELRECGLSVSEFLAKDFPQPQKTVTKPKRKPRKTAVTKKKTPVKKKTPAKKKTTKKVK